MTSQQRAPFAEVSRDGPLPEGVSQGAAEVAERLSSREADDLVQVNVRLEKQLRKAIKRAALEEDVTVNEWVTDAVLQKLGR